MPQQDAVQIKEKIISILRRRGPSIPVQIGRETNLSILFASAFLSELVSDKKVKMSNMRVGSSPIYFLPGQESSLEKFSDHLKSKEKDAFLLLRERKFVKDETQQPAIRVALREIKDFAIPFKKEEILFWRYFVIPENEFGKVEEIIIEKKPVIEQEEAPIAIQKGIAIEEAKSPISHEEQKPLEIFDKKLVKKTKSKKIQKNSKNSKDDKFFNKVKEFLAKKSIEILDIEGFNKKHLILKVKDNGKEKLLIAYNKKKISDSDLMKAHKKAMEINLPYLLLSLGEIPKKLEDFIDAIKNLSGTGKLE